VAPRPSSGSDETGSTGAVVSFRSIIGGGRPLLGSEDDQWDSGEYRNPLRASRRRPRGDRAAPREKTGASKRPVE